MDASPKTARQPTDSTEQPPAAQRPDMRGGLRVFLGLDIMGRLLIWSSSVALTTGIFTALDVWPASSIVGADWGMAFRWAQRLASWVVLFNLIYVAELILLRLPIPTPKEGRYSTLRRIPDRQIMWSCLIAILTKARYEAPFPAFLVFNFSNLPPLGWLMGRVFGPRSRSCYVTDPRIIDPHLVTLGRNVTIGLNTTVIGHYQERDSVVFARTVIEDEVLVGGHAVIFGGVHIKSGSQIGAGAIVLPRTVVGPNEFWAGVPARKIRDITPVTQVANSSQA